MCPTQTISTHRTLTWVVLPERQRSGNFNFEIKCFLFLYFSAEPCSAQSLHRDPGSDGDDHRRLLADGLAGEGLLHRHGYQDLRLYQGKQEHALEKKRISQFLIYIFFCPNSRWCVFSTGRPGSTGRRCTAAWAWRWRTRSSWPTSWSELSVLEGWDDKEIKQNIYIYIFEAIIYYNSFCFEEDFYRRERGRLSLILNYWTYPSSLRDG